jgi:hypothetical protein
MDRKSGTWSESKGKEAHFMLRPVYASPSFCLRFTSAFIEQGLQHSSFMKGDRFRWILARSTKDSTRSLNRSEWSNPRLVLRKKCHSKLIYYRADFVTSLSFSVRWGSILLWIDDLMIVWTIIRMITSLMMIQMMILVGGKTFWSVKKSLPQDTAPLHSLWIVHFAN